MLVKSDGRNSPASISPAPLTKDSAIRRCICGRQIDAAALGRQHPSTFAVPLLVGAVLLGLVAASYVVVFPQWILLDHY
jgi:hypothetical protein